MQLGWVVMMCFAAGTCIPNWLGQVWASWGKCGHLVGWVDGWGGEECEASVCILGASWDYWGLVGTSGD